MRHYFIYQEGIDPVQKKKSPADFNCFGQQGFTLRKVRNTLLFYILNYLLIYESIHLMCRYLKTGYLHIQALSQYKEQDMHPRAAT
jgi:hypothetical protein